MSSSKNKNIETQTNSADFHPDCKRSKNSPMVLYGQRPPTLGTHCHHPRSEGVDDRARKSLYLVSAMCIILMACEIVGGILANSLAVILDAAHLSVDFASFMIALFAIWIAGRQSTQRFNFGWYRAEVIGALFSVLLIWMLTGELCYLAIQRILEPSFEIDAVIMMITSGIAVVVNFSMGLLLQLYPMDWNCLKKIKVMKQKYRPKLIVVTSNIPKICTSSEHFLCPCKNQGTQTSKLIEEISSNNYRYEGNLTVRAAFINALSDMIQSIGVFLGGVIIYYHPSWIIVDPILTFLFAIIVILATLGIIRDGLLVLMESTPSFLDYTEVEQLFLSIEGVESIHNLRLWALNLNKVACLAHLEIAENANPMEILERTNYIIHQRYHFFETTIQIETKLI